MRIPRILAVPFVLAGCWPSASSKPPSEDAGAPAFGSIPADHVTDEQREQVRESDRQLLRQVLAQPDPATQLRQAMELTLGKTAYAQGMQAPLPVSTSIRELHEAGVTLRVVPYKDRDGNVIDDKSMLLEDSIRQRAQVLQRKVAEGAATPQEKRELEEGHKYTYKLGDLQTQLTTVGNFAMNADGVVLDGAVSTMDSVGSMIRGRYVHSMQWTDEDYAVAGAFLAQQRRAEMVAALGIGLAAAYRAVIEDGADPEAIDVLAREGSEALKVSPEVSLEEAREYVENFGMIVGEVRTRQQQVLREAWGDERYEAILLPVLESKYAHLEDAVEMSAAGRPGASSGQPNQVAADYAQRAVAAFDGTAALREGLADRAIDRAVGLVPVSGLAGIALKRAAGLVKREAHRRLSNG